MIRRAAFLLVTATLGAPGVRAETLLADAARQNVDIEERVRWVVVHRLEGDLGALTGDLAALEAYDERRRDRGLAPSGLTDVVRYLAAGAAPGRDAQRHALEDVLDEDPDPVVRRLAEHRLEADDGATAGRLLADDRHNRRAAIVNDFVRPLGVFSGGAVLAALNPFLLAGSALDSVVSTAVNLWHYNRLSAAEREALARYRTLVERQPRTEDAPEIVAAIRRLGRKRAEALCAETVALGKKAFEADDLDHAAFYLRQAETLEGCAKKANGPVEDLEEALVRRATREEAGRWPVDDPPTPEPGAEARDYEALLTATALGEPGPMIEAASRFTRRHEDSELAPGARYVIAVARDLAGHRDEARAALADLAAESGAAGEHAAAVLASPEFSRLDALAAAERRHLRDTLKFVFLGGGLDGRTALHGAAALGSSGVAAAQSLGIFNVIGVLTRAWQAWRRDPVSNQAIIDHGEEFLAREPGSPQAPDIHARLAEAYERAGQYGRALMHYRATAVPDASRIERLEAKIADQLLEEADRTAGGDPVLLSGIVRHFGATKAADKARKRLAARPEAGDATLERDLLLANPALLGPDGLDLDPALLDGERKNGELADAGVALREGTLRLTLRNVDGPGQHVETRSLSPEAYARARAAAQEVLYGRLLTADGRDPETGRFERYIPFYLQGAVGAKGLSVAPGVKMRRYRSEDRRLYE
jgi:hypothetical protein